MSADGTRRDPFEAAADEAFRNAPDRAPDPTDGPGRARTPPDTGGFGRDAAGSGKTELGAPRTMPTPDRAEVRAHTPIAATPPDEPAIYKRASDERTSGVVDAERAMPATGDGGPGADPSGERFRSGAFSNEPGWLKPGPKNAQLCYWLNLAGFVVWPLPLVSVAMAAVNRSKVGAPLATHYTYALRTVPLVVLYGLLAYAMGRAAGIALVAVVVWFVWRNLRGLARAGAGQPIEKPGAWLV